MGKRRKGEDVTGQDRLDEQTDGTGQGGEVLRHGFCLVQSANEAELQDTRCLTDRAMGHEGGGKALSW